MASLAPTAAPAPADTGAARDNLLGICHRTAAIFGFDPLLLRLAFVASVLASFELALVAYAALGVALVIAQRPWRRR